MPDITITVTNAQAQRIAAAFGPPPEGMTLQELVTQRTKAFWKEQVRRYESAQASNIAFEAAATKVETDFTGF